MSDLKTKTTQAVPCIEEYTLEKVYKNLENRLCFAIRGRGGHFQQRFTKNILLPQVVCVNDNPKRLKTFRIIASNFRQIFYQHSVLHDWSL